MAGGFRFLEHTADVYVEVWGDSLGEVLEQAALALFEVMTDTSRVRPERPVEVEVEGDDLMNLLYRWVEEWLYTYEVEGMVFSKFKVHEVRELEGGGYLARGCGWGEPFDPERHEPRTEVKAMTYSDMSIERVNGRWVARFVLDI